MATDNVPRNTFHDKGPSLADVVATSSAWENVIVPIGSAFRRALAVLTGLVGAAAGAVTFAIDEVSPFGEKPSLFLAGWPLFLRLLDVLRTLLPVYIALAVLLVVAAVITEGFAVAGPRLQIALAVVATVTTLALLPVAAVVLIPVANVVAYVVGTVLLVVFIGWVLFAMLDS